MILKNYYWWFKDALPHRFCDDIIKYGKELKSKEGLASTGDFGKDRDLKRNPLTKQELKKLKKTRNSNVVWMEDPWIYKEIHPYVNAANKNAGWNFQWDWSESCQFTKYAKGQYYDWHFDSWDEPYSITKGTNYEGKIRKLSVTLSLSDASEYEGGELEFSFPTNGPHKKPNIVQCKEIRTKGSLVVFPSNVWHRVKPVTKGTRYSLVIWSIGQPFK